MNAPITFVIPCLNASSTIAETLTSIQLQDYTGSMEIIVVDNGSSDESVKIVMDMGVRVLNCQKIGASAARNWGWRSSKTELIAFVDSDVVLAKDWTTSILKYFEQNVVGSQSVIWPHMSFQKRFIDNYRMQRKLILTGGTGIELDPSKGRYLVNTAACVLRRSALETVGGFEEELLRLEDLDISLKLSSLGVLLPCPQAIAHVKFSGNWDDYLKRSFRDGRESVVFSRLWNGKIKYFRKKKLIKGFLLYDGLNWVVYNLGMIPGHLSKKGLWPRSLSIYGFHKKHSVGKNQ